MSLVILGGVSENLIHSVQEWEVHAVPRGQFSYLQGPWGTPYPPGQKVACLISPLRFYLSNLACRP